MIPACYLHEDPWERLRKIKSHMKNTKLQMLLRGQNLLGYHHYSGETVKNAVKEKRQPLQTAEKCVY